MKQILQVAGLLALMTGGALALGQSSSPSAVKGGSFNASPSSFDLAAGYNFIHANAPPGQCGCFNMNGGFVAADLNFGSWLGVEGMVTGGHAADISTLGQNLTLTTFAGGPRVLFPLGRITPYADVLFGLARGTGSYFPSGSSSSSSASSFLLAPGGGVDFGLSQHFAIRGDAAYLRTSFPNNAGNTQNHLQIGAGIVFRFGGSGGNAEVVTPPPPRPQERVAFACSAGRTNFTVGEPVRISGQVETLPGNMQVNYTWTENGQAITGDGPTVTIQTAGLAPGSYQISGRATLISDPSIQDTCSTAFQLNAAVAAAPPAPVAAAPTQGSGVSDMDFQNHVKDVFFGYDKYTLSPEAQQTVSRNLAFLMAHPELTVTLAGYTDIRGSEEYNLALGLNRAKSVRDALVAGGIDASRLRVVTYGKEKQFCTERNESCYRSNRRVQFVRGE